ncbi:hypothetical protein EMIT074MI3_10388 [Bacillus licheniformis]
MGEKKGTRVVLILVYSSLYSHIQVMRNQLEGVKEHGTRESISYDRNGKEKTGRRT